MEIGPNLLASARADFQRARQQAALQDILARFTGRSTSLLAFDEAYKKLRATGMVDRGLKDIPIAAIVGSVNRYGDFSRSFLPRLDADVDRWAAVKAITVDPARSGLEPIQVYQIGEAYFVSDGNHRVSVARQMGTQTIEAYVVEVQTRVPLSAEASPEELILKSELADLLERTGLDRTRPGSDFTVTVPGETFTLAQQMDAFHEALKVVRGDGVNLADAAGQWYDEVYLPVVLSIRDRGILRDFPGRTETDLFIWILEHRDELEAELGWQVKPAAAAASLVAQSAGPVGQGLLAMLADGPAAGEWRKDKIEDRYTDHLFRGILVPLSGEESGWAALSQAIVVAKREGARLNGLHVVPDEAARETEAVRLMKELFERRCQAAGVEGTLATEVGEIAACVCSRAVLNDLVVVNVAHPPSAQPLARLGSGFRTLIRRCARPLLAAPGAATALGRVLLAYDGSPKANEALFVATYFAEQWKAVLTVLTAVETDAHRTAVEHARKYLEMHEIEASFVIQEVTQLPAAVLNQVKEQGIDLIVMGGYSRSPVVEIVMGSAVDQVLRETHVPMLICR
jgi:nucleotide-binding universal stress UspA family protein